MFKKAVSLSSALVVLAATFLPGLATVSAATNDPEFAKALTWMNTNGYTMYNDEDSFRPFSTLRRDEAAKFISTFATTVLSGCRQYVVQGCEFADASDINPSLTSSVQTACEYGLMIGSVGSNGARYFYPTANVTKAQFVTTMIRAYEGLKDENGNPWYLNYYNAGINRGIISQAHNPTAYSLDKNLTRYEAALMLYRSSSMGCTTGSVTTGTVNTGTTVVNNWTVTVSLASNTNQGVNGTIYVPNKSTNNRIMSIDVVSNNGTARVDTITVDMDDSLMNRNDAKVSIVDENGVRLTNVRTFNSNNEAILTFNSPFIVDSKVRNLTVMFDFSGSVNQRTTLTVKNFTSSGSTFALSNVTSKYINTVDISSSSNKITISTVGWANSVACTSASSFVYIGETNKLLGRFTLDYTSSNNKSAIVTAIRFKSTKSLGGIVSNLKLVSGTGTVSEKAVIDSRYITFTFGSGYVMPYGSSKSFYIYGDIVGGQANDAIELYVENDGDVSAYELSASLIALNTVKNDSLDYTQLYCIKEGSNSITRIDGLSATNIPTREQMIQGLVASVTTKSAIRVDKIKVWAADSTVTGAAVNPATDIENIRLYLNGVLVDNTSSISYDSTAAKYYYEIGAYRDLNGGANTVEVRFDTKSTATVGNTVTFSLNPSSFVYGSNAVYNTSENNVLISDFNGSADGARLIIKNPGVDNISLTDSATNLTRVKESADFSAIQFGVRPSNVRDIILNGFRLNINSFSGVAGAANSNFVTDATVVVDGVAVQTVSFSQGLSATFNSLGIVIPRSSQKDIKVLVKTTQQHPDGSTNDVQYSVSNFDIQDVNGNTIATVNGVSTSTYSLLGRALDVAASINVTCKLTDSRQGVVTSNLSGTDVATFNFKSDYGAASLRELTIANVTDAGATVSSDSTLVGYYSTARSTYYDDSANGTTLIAYVNGTKIGEATLINGIAYIRNIADGVGYTIPSNGSINVVIKAVSNSTLTNGRIRLRAISPNLSNTSFLEGSAQTLISAINSNSTVGWSCTSATSSAMYIRKTILTVANTARTITTSVAPGSEIYSTNITADAAGDAVVKTIRFNVSMNAWFVAPTSADFALEYAGRIYDNSTETTCTYASNSVTCTFIGTYDDGVTINAGTSANFKLRASSAGAGIQTVSTATNAQLTVNMSRLSSDGNAYVAASVPTPTSLVWSDQSAQGHSLTTADWYTDASLNSY